jgi:pimeloyl-ACP methyl ester carboxylesterase
MTRSDLVGYEGGRGDTVVLIPGMGCSWRVWKAILPALCVKRHVVALDLPGFAGSARLPVHVRPTVAALADAVERGLEGRASTVTQRHRCPHWVTLLATAAPGLWR